MYKLLYSTVTSWKGENKGRSSVSKCQLALNSVITRWKNFVNRHGDSNAGFYPALAEHTFTLRN